MFPEKHIKARPTINPTKKKKFLFNSFTEFKLKKNKNNNNKKSLIEVKHIV